MEMRLGKSVTALRWAFARCRDRNVDSPHILILAPSTPIIDWMAELEREGHSYVHVHGTKRKRSEILGMDLPSVVLFTYSSVIVTPEIRNIRWDAVILDESTTIKNPKAKITKFCLRYLTSVPVRAVLTGLPNPQSEFELWTQMAFVNGGQWMGHSNYYNWRQRVGYLAGFSWEMKREYRPKVKSQLHQDAYVLTREDAKVGSEKIPIRRSGVLESRERRIYREAVDKWEIPGLDREKVEAKHNVVVCSWLRRITGGFLPDQDLDCWKYPYVVELLSNDLKQCQVVIWFAFNKEIARLADALKRAYITHTTIDGTVELEERARRIGLFRTGKRRIILAQVACGKYGLDLAQADTAIYFSNSYSYEARRQSEDRIVSAAKSRPLAIIDLITQNTVDEDVHEGLQEKQESANYYVSKIMKNKRCG